MSLTSAYAPFVNGGKKIEPKLISRIQDRRGKTIFKKKAESVLVVINLSTVKKQNFQ